MVRLIQNCQAYPRSLARRDASYLAPAKHANGDLHVRCRRFPAGNQRSRANHRGGQTQRTRGR